MRIVAVALGLLATSCVPQEPGFDAGLQRCGDASMGGCVRGPAGACDLRDRVPEECGIVPACACECPPGYVPESDCGG